MRCDATVTLTRHQPLLLHRSMGGPANNAGWLAQGKNVRLFDGGGNAHTHTLRQTDLFFTVRRHWVDAAAVCLAGYSSRVK